MNDGGEPDGGDGGSACTPTWRRPITLDNTANPAALNDYQVRLKLDTAALVAAGKLRPDCSDLRATDSAGNALPFWVEGPCGDRATRVWLRVPTLPAAGLASAVFSYGVPGSTSPSSSAATFLRELGPLLGAWSFDEDAGGFVRDSSAAGNNAAAYLGYTGRAPGRFGGAIAFFGSASEATVATAGTSDVYLFDAGSDFSVSAWIQTTVGGSYQQVLGTEREVNNTGFAFFIAGDDAGVGTGSVCFDSSSSCCLHACSTRTVNDGGWHHVVGVRQGDGTRLYVDGVLDGTLPSGAAVPFDQAGLLRFGENAERDRPYLGLLDEVRIYGRALSGAEVQDLSRSYGQVLPASNDRELLRRFSVPEPVASVGPEEPDPLCIPPDRDAGPTGTPCGPDGTRYERVVRIENTTGGALNDWQVRVVVDTASAIAAGRLSADCADLRVTDDTFAAVPFWLEGPCNASATRLWVRVASIPALGETSLRLLYGSPLAPSLSSSAGTFVRSLSPLLGAWTFDDGPGTYFGDSSGGGSPGVAFSTLSPPGKFGNSVSFINASSFVIVTPPTAADPFRFSPSVDFSVSFWMNRPGRGTYWEGMLGNEWAPTRNGFSFILDAHLDGGPGTLAFTSRNSCCPAAAGTRYVEDGQWHHVVGVRQGDALSLYVDGALDGTLPSGAAVPFDQSAPLLFGQDLNAYFVYGGMLDEVRIYGRALTAAEVSDLFQTYGFVSASLDDTELLRRTMSPEPVTTVGPEVALSLADGGTGCR
jgi:hypothetical protein